MLAKVNIRSAYQLVPVHPEDRWLLGMSWESRLFDDTVLPFGFRSAPKIFTAMADAVEWMARSRDVQTLTTIWTIFCLWPIHVMGLHSWIAC